MFCTVGLSWSTRLWRLCARAKGAVGPSTVAAESIYSLNCHLVQQRLGRVLSTSYRSARSPNFVLSRIFSLVHYGDLALKRVICCRWMYCSLNDETRATCFMSEEIVRLLQQPQNLVIKLKQPVSGGPGHKIKWCFHLILLFSLPF